MKIDIEARNKFLAAVAKQFGGDKNIITRKEVVAVHTKAKLPFPHWLTIGKEFREGRGTYRLFPDTTVKTEKPVVEKMADESYIPDKDKNYVPFGHYADVKEIVKTGIFYPTYVTGLSGNGKTLMIEQVHAELRKEYIRVNITIETDEDDLLGGFRLVDGATVWQDGPVITAMKRGCTLLLDEVDLGSNKLLCLQPVLEGKSIYLKKILTRVKPAPGFNIFATANTKGKGSEDGRFMGTNVLNEAFLERFSITMEQEYPDEKIERKILVKLLKSKGHDTAKDTDFAEKLVTWANATREAFKNGSISEIISTRRLAHIIEAYHIFGGSRKKSINLCLNRFDAETKPSLIQFYEKIDENYDGTVSDKPKNDGTITANSPFD